MTDSPFLARAVSEKIRCREKEQSPTSFPKFCVISVDAVHQFLDLIFVVVKICEPIECRALVMTPVPFPLVFDFKKFTEIPD